MREELNHIEQIERYLRNEMSSEERTAFEEKLRSDPNLQQEVKLHRELIEGVERASLKIKAQKAYKAIKTMKFIKWGLGGFGAAVLATFIIWSVTDKNLFISASENKEQQLQQAIIDKTLPSEFFTIDTKQDTVIETKGGIVMAIPANCFIDEDGNPVTGEIDFEVKEALDGPSIMKAGLSTMSGDKPLETGGMFYINALRGGRPLKIAPGKGIYTEVPTDEVKDGMQLFDGVVQSDGSIDWQNPKPLETFLTPVDIHILDFYPPNYIDSLNAMGQDVDDKNFTDSLYYSFASQFKKRKIEKLYKFINPNNHDSIGSINILEDERVLQNPFYKRAYELRGEYNFNKHCASCHGINNDLTGPALKGITEKREFNWLINYIANSHKMIADGDPTAIELYEKWNKTLMPTFENKLHDLQIASILFYIKHGTKPGINPAKIKAIWSDKFQNTLLATREFEERLPYIHQSCNEAVLDLYVNNLNKRMATIDSMAANMATGELKQTFMRFAARNEGRVKTDDSHLQKLKEYYAKKQQLITEAIYKTEQAFREKHAQLDQKTTNKKVKKSQKELERKSDNFKKEFEINLDEVYHQLGHENRPKYIPAYRPATYKANITSTGWKNIDAYITTTTYTRESFEYTDEKGDKAVINYNPITITIKDNDSYDKLFVYLLPNELNSFMRVKVTNDVYKEQLNELIDYSLACLAYKGDEVFFFKKNKIKPKNYKNIQLKMVASSELEEELKGMSINKHAIEILEDYDYQKFIIADNKRKTRVKSILELRKKIQSVVLPCYPTPEPSSNKPEEGLEIGDDDASEGAFSTM